MGSLETETHLPAEANIGKKDMFSHVLNLLGIENSWTSLLLEKIITLEEVSFHDRIDDCWIIIYDRVYDITKFLRQHPGGPDILLEYAGRDATIAFRGTGHSQIAITAITSYMIGRLPEKECIYRKHGGIYISDLPD